MLKTISAALLAVSVLAVPAFAGTVKATQAPVIKAGQMRQVKPSVLNANARMPEQHRPESREARQKSLAQRFSAG